MPLARMSSRRKSAAPRKRSLAEALARGAEGRTIEIGRNQRENAGVWARIVDRVSALETDYSVLRSGGRTLVLLGDCLATQEGLPLPLNDKASFQRAAAGHAFAPPGVVKEDAPPASLFDFFATECRGGAVLKRSLACAREGVKYVAGGLEPREFEAELRGYDVVQKAIASDVRADGPGRGRAYHVRVFLVWHGAELYFHPTFLVGRAREGEVITEAGCETLRGGLDAARSSSLQRALAALRGMLLLRSAPPRARLSGGEETACLLFMAADVVFEAETLCAYLVEMNAPRVTDADADAFPLRDLASFDRPGGGYRRVGT